MSAPLKEIQILNLVASVELKAKSDIHNSSRKEAADRTAMPPPAPRSASQTAVAIPIVSQAERAAHEHNLAVALAWCRALNQGSQNVQSVLPVESAKSDASTSIGRENNYRKFP